MMRRIVKGLSVFLLGVVVMGMTAWGVGAIYYADFSSAILRQMMAAVFGVGTIVAFLLMPRRRLTLLGFCIVWIALVVWWSTIKPSNTREWSSEVAVSPYATIEEHRVTLHNIRNFDYRTATGFTPRYYDKTFDLRQLDSVDLVSSYWAGEAIAHLMVSFGFAAGKDYVTVSIETRKERGEGYSSLKGFFKQYELIYVVADERDVIRVRTNYRQPREDVYLYRVRMSRARMRRIFMDYVERINGLSQQPEFYNTLTTNCTTTILLHAQASGGSARYNWKILLSGHTPAYAYEMGRLDTRLPFPELRKLGHVNARAWAADQATDFSQQIRQGLPAPRPVSD